MSEARGTKNYYNFTQGIVTDSSKLFPVENSCTDMQNMELSTDGSIKRRLGIDFEPDANQISTGYTGSEMVDKSVDIYEWENVSEISDFTILVVHVGQNLYFFDKASKTISDTQLNGGASLALSEIVKDIQGTSILGKFVFSTNRRGVNILSYDVDTDTVSIESSLLKVRDIWGVDDNLSVTDQPALSLSDEHKYNLINQGWSTRNLRVAAPGGVLSTSIPYEGYKSDIGTYPSNAQPMMQTADSNGYFSVNTEIINQTYFGDTPAPKGAAVIDIFQRGTCRVEFVADADNKLKSSVQGDTFVLNNHYINGAVAVPPSGWLEDRSVGGVVSVASYAGRVAYLLDTTSSIDKDPKAPSLGGLVCISQLVKSTDNISACYQSADPTSQDISDIIDTDGVVLQIVGMKTPTKIVEFEDKLLVFASNGVWEIYGGDTGFTATNIVVRKVSEEGCIGGNSVIKASNSVLYWSQSSIYRIVADERTRVSIATDAIHGRLKKTYSSITFSARSSAKAVFSSSGLKVYWMYNDNTSYTGVYFKDTYNKVLIYDVGLDAYYINSIGSTGDTSPYIAGIVEKTRVETYSVEADVVDSFGNFVIDSSGNQVVSLSTTSISSDSEGDLTYLTMTPTVSGYTFTFSSLNNTSFTDWLTSDDEGIDAEAYFTTYAEVLEEAAKKKQVTYITCFFNPVDTAIILDENNELDVETDSSCLLQSHWGWATEVNSSKWSSERQAYRLNRLTMLDSVTDKFEYPDDVVVTKNKLRGRGNSVALKFKSEPNKALHILGWSTTYSSNTAV